MTDPVLAFVIAGLVVLARLAWPERRPWPGGEPQGGPGLGGELSPGSGSTVEDVADALVLLALALRGGRSPLAALDDVAGRVVGDVALDLRSVAASHRWGLLAEEAWRAVPDVWAPAAAAWVAAERAGVSPGPLLDRAAASVRSRAAADREAALQRAAVLLVLPLGLAFLPGFVLTTVAPTVWRLVPALLGG